ncbi:MAG: efflux RND transporter permease subunit [Pseudomonadota bacterium]
MTGIIDWLAVRARMVVLLVMISLGFGAMAYVSLPKEGDPNIDIPILYVSVPLQGVSATDSERLLVKPLEDELGELDGLKEMTGIAAEGYAGVLLEFHFGWDKSATLADVRNKVDKAEAEFPEDAEKPSINEVNLSELPIIVVSLSGAVPERTLLRAAKRMQRRIEALPEVLEADLRGARDEMVEVLIDPLKMESYDVRLSDLNDIVSRNNRLVAAGQIEGGTGAFSVSVPGAFEDPRDVYDLPVKTNGDSIVRISDIAEVRRTFEDATGTARFNGETAFSLRVSKRLGQNIISTVESVRAAVDEELATWPPSMRAAVNVDSALDVSKHVKDMVSQLESAVLTACILVMIVILATLGFRSALLVGIAIPCSFLLTFALMAALGMTVSNMTMFGLILAVGILVDGAIVVVENADKRIAAGEGPMRAYTLAAKRMFWPIAASTGTTLCAFLPMLFWPGLAGEFMGQLPVTIIFVLTASLIVALLYMPVLGGIVGRAGRALGLEKRQPVLPEPPKPYRRSLFGRAVGLIVLNPIGPLVAIGVAASAIFGIFSYYGTHNNGTQFFTDLDADRANVFIRARGNLSLSEQDRLTRIVEDRVRAIDGVESVFAFAGTGGGGVGEDEPADSVGEVLIELENWRTRRPPDEIYADVRAAVANLPGFTAEVVEIEDGPEQGKPVQLELRSYDWDRLLEAAAISRQRFSETEGLVEIDDTTPLPGIQWEVSVDRATAGRYGADITTVGPFVQFVTLGATLDTLRADDSDDELDIRARFPADQRTLSTLDSLKVPTAMGQVPLSNFVERKAVNRLSEIQRREDMRFVLVRANVTDAVTDVEMLNQLEEWLAEAPLPPGVEARFVGDREEQEESQGFLTVAFAGALGLMFILLLAQFNSVYNAVLVLSAVVMSVAGVLIGALVMGQTFSIIMTGLGIVALAGIVVNNNIVLIDTFQEFRKRMPPLEAIVRTAEDRIRPVLLTTITTMIGLTPMMFAVSLDFVAGTVAFGAPSAKMWVQLATAVVWGLGFATVLTLIVTPAALAAREWAVSGLGFSLRWVWHAAIAAVWPAHRDHPFLADRRLRRALAKRASAELIWDEGREPRPLLRAAE